MVIENYGDFYVLYTMVSLDIIDEIDRLWMDYSEEKFGIKGQAKIYRDLGGRSEYNAEYNEKVWNRFGDRIGWQEGGRWLKLEEVAYHATTQPDSIFPILMYSLDSVSGGIIMLKGWGLVGLFCGGWGSLLSRRDLTEHST